MAAKFICDGCGKETQAGFYPTNAGSGWHKPHSWYQRMDEDGIQDACSRECIDKVAAATKKTAVVSPF